MTDSNAADYEVNLSRMIYRMFILIAKRTDIQKDVKQRVIDYAEDLPHMRDWFEKEIGTDWKDKLQAVK